MTSSWVVVRVLIFDITSRQTKTSKVFFSKVVSDLECKIVGLAFCYRHVPSI